MLYATYSSNQPKSFLRCLISFAQLIVSDSNSSFLFLLLPGKFHYITCLQALLRVWLQYAQALHSHTLPFSPLPLLLLMFPAVKDCAELRRGASFKITKTHPDTPRCNTYKFLYVCYDFSGSIVFF